MVKFYTKVTLGLTRNSVPWPLVIVILDYEMDVEIIQKLAAIPSSLLLKRSKI